MHLRPMHLRLASRGSPLALIQTNLVSEKLVALGHTTEVIVIKTSGDKNQTTSLADMGGKALFAKEIQQALLDRTADLGVHSLKDLEVDHPQGLHLLGVLERAAPSDVLITQSSMDMTKPFVLGTCSPRRSAFAKDLWPMATIVPLRGNVQTRLGKLEAGDMDATIMAKAGLERLGIYESLKDQFHVEDLSLDLFVPAVCQGIIGIEGLLEFSEIVAAINHEPTYQSALQERRIIKEFGGNCHSAIGVYSAHGKTRVRYEKDGLLESADLAT